MNPNIKLADRIAVLAALNPASVAPGAVTTAYVSMANFHSISALIQAGAFGASATVDAKLVQATDASGTGSKPIAGKAITQILAASGGNVQAQIDARNDDLDTNNGYAFVALTVTVGVAATIVGAQLVGSNARFAPASAFNAASVVQVV